MKPDRLVIIANRLPIAPGDRGWDISAGGLVTALRPVMQRHRGAWIGWDGGAVGVPPRVGELAVDLEPVSLKRSDVQGYYHGFANSTIWPLFHDLVEPAHFDRSWWRSYAAVNQHFADAAADEAKNKRALVWVQDYHLMLVPDLLRSAGAKGRIGFFLHIPWPPPELYSRLPWRESVLKGLLGADVVSFHTERYRKNFVRTCGRLLPDVTVKGKKILLEDGREVLTTAHPISIDAGEFADLAKGTGVEKAVRKLGSQFRGRRLLLGVDRLDYTKGILERLEAFEQLIERRPKLRDSLVFVQIAVPSRGAVTEYRNLREQIEQAVGRINGRFTDPGADVPVHYIHRALNRERLGAYYLSADVMLVTPLKDGMNLVAKEFVVCQEAARGSGALVLSEFTGAADELKEALQCNPFDVEALSYRIEDALNLDEEDRARRIASMGRWVRRNDVHAWVEKQLEDISGGVGLDPSR